MAVLALTDSVAIAAPGSSGKPVTNHCNLYDYFQFIFRSNGRPFDCTNIPAEFWTYQTRVGEVASSGKSSSGSAAAAAGAAAASSSANATTMISQTPTASLTAGASLLRYTAGLDDMHGQRVISDELSMPLVEKYSDLPPLERAIWVKPTGTLGRRNQTSDNASVAIEAGGLLAGMDLFSDEYARIGILGGVSQIKVEINENNNNINVFTARGGATATVEIGKWYFDALGTVSNETYDTERTVDINNAGDLRRMWSNYNNMRVNAAFETGFRFTLGSVVIQPLGGVEMNWLYQEAVKEKGNDKAAIWTAENVIRTGSTKLGLNLQTVFFLGDIPIVPTIGGFWSHRFGELNNASRISTDQGATYEQVGAEPSVDLANVYAGLAINVSDNFTLSGNYSASFNSIERNHTGTIGLRLHF